MNLEQTSWFINVHQHSSTFRCHSTLALPQGLGSCTTEIGMRRCQTKTILQLIELNITDGILSYFVIYCHILSYLVIFLSYFCPSSGMIKIPQVWTYLVLYDSLDPAQNGCGNLYGNHSCCNQSMITNTRMLGDLFAVFGMGQTSVKYEALYKKPR